MPLKDCLGSPISLMSFTINDIKEEDTLYGWAKRKAEEIEYVIEEEFPAWEYENGASLTFCEWVEMVINKLLEEIKARQLMLDEIYGRSPHVY